MNGFCGSIVVFNMVKQSRNNGEPLASRTSTAPGSHDQMARERVNQALERQRYLEKRVKSTLKVNVVALKISGLL